MTTFKAQDLIISHPMWPWWVKLNLSSFKNVRKLGSLDLPYEYALGSLDPGAAQEMHITLIETD